MHEPLKNCPFCGAAAHFEMDEDRWEWVECESCGMQGNRSASLMEDCKPKLAEEWNRRTPQPTQARAGAVPYPMAGDEDESDLGNWQDGATKPTMDGTYLREFDEGLATSEFYEGKWLRDGFFPSDIQDAHWRGRNAPQPTPTAQPAPPPTPQADSQPAPTNTRQIAECYGDCPTDQKTCANPCKFEGRAASATEDSVTAPAGGGVAGPSKWTVEEILDGNRGIRWVTEGVIHGRPTDHDVREYLMRTPAMRGCLCDDCKAFYTPAQAADSVQEDAARESEYQRGYRHGYEQRDAEVRGSLA